MGRKVAGSQVRGTKSVRVNLQSGPLVSRPVGGADQKGHLVRCLAFCYG